MKYRWETMFWFNIFAHSRLDTHQNKIRGNMEANSIARHLAEEPSTRRPDSTALSLTVERAREWPLTRLIRKAHKIANGLSGRWSMRESHYSCSVCQNSLNQFISFLCFHYFGIPLLLFLTSRHTGQGPHQNMRSQLCCKNLNYGTVHESITNDMSL